MPHRPAHSYSFVATAYCPEGLSSAPMRSDMDATPATLPAYLNMARPRSEQPVQSWIAAPTDHLQASLRAAQWPAPPIPQVIYAERRPRLSGPELLAKYGSTVPAPSTVRLQRPDNCRSPRLMGSLPRIIWWSTLALDTITYSLSVPLI